MKILIFLLTVTLSLCSHAKDYIPSVEKLLVESRSSKWSEAVSSSVVIDAPVEEVWDYFSDSTNASEWSVFFDHITPLRGPVEDGKVGSFRRCFRNADETGPRWDEITFEVIPYKVRQIATFNLVHFGFRALTKNDHLLVRQRVKPLSNGRTELAFDTLSPASNNIVSRLAFVSSRKKTKRIFYQNLVNIKAIVEGKPAPHTWE